MSQLLLRNRYRVLRRLGAGGVGSVYAVAEVPEQQGRPPLALKALFTEREQQALVSSLRLEFRVLATLRHPLIARVYDFGRLPQGNQLEGGDGRPGFFFTRDLVEGQDLQEAASGQSLADVCRLCQRTAEVLDILHRAGMVHGDFKPANVIVSLDGRPHLIDFGLARGEGQTSMPSGTAAFLAPETLQGKLVDRRVDLYALGITLYQLVTGTLPLPDASLGELISWHVDGPPLQLAEEHRAPPELGAVVTRLTQRDPDRRYPSAAEVAFALAEAATAAGAAPQPPHVSIFVPPPPGENLVEPLARLEQAARDRTLQGKGPALLAVVGETGSGKSSMLRELTWRSQLAGVEVIRGEFQAGDPRAYGLLRDLLDQVAGAVGLEHPLDRESAEERDRYALYQRISAFLATAARRAPLLLLLDSVEQADPESLAALRFLGHTLDVQDRLQLVLAYRPSEELHQALGHPERVQLEPLGEKDVERMVEDTAGRSDPALAARIHQHTGGNPLFVMDVLRRLSEARWPPRPDLQQLAPPQPLEDTYASRWSGLPTDEQLVLSLLAVLGRPASAALIWQVIETHFADSDPPFVGLPLERLEQEEWLERRPDGLMAFRQGPAAQVIYAATDQALRQSLHGAAAAVLQQQASADAVELTRHALGASQLELAWPQLEQAVARLKSVGSYRAAIQLYEKVAALLGEDADRLRWVRQELGELYRAVGDYPSAAQQLELAALAAEGLERTRIQVALARVHRQAGEVEQALRLLEQVLDQEPPATEQIAALAETAASYLVQGLHRLVLEHVDRALLLLDEQPAEGTADQAVRAELQGRRAWSLGFLQPGSPTVDAEFETAQQEARQTGDPRVECNILNSWASVLLHQGGYPQAIARYERALDCAQQSGDIERVATIRYNLATCQLWRGGYSQALDHLGESLRLFEAMDAQERAAGARCGLGRLELTLGLYEKARETLERATAECVQVGKRSSEALARLLLAQVQARRGRLAEARRGIAQAHQLYLEIGRQQDAADALLDLADLELGADAPELARDALERAAALVDLQEVSFLWIRNSSMHARVAARIGSPAEQQAATAALARTLTLAEEQDAPELRWESHYAAMELCQAQGQSAQAQQHAHAAHLLQESMAAGLPQEIRSAFFQEPRRRLVRERAQRQLQQAAQAAQQVGEMTLPPAAAADLDNTIMGQEQTISSSSELLAPPTAAQALAQQEERFYRLLEIYRRINTELDRERLLELVMDTAVELTGAERGFLLLGEAPGKLQIEAARNLNPSAQGDAYSRSIAERVFSAGQPVITISAHNDPRFAEYLSVHQLQLESVLCIPIHARGKAAGVLYMESRFQSGRFTPRDQRLLMAFGDQVAIALTNARLLEENVRKARELERAKAEIEALAEERGQLLGQRTAELERTRQDLAETRRRLRSQSGLYGMIGRSEPMLRLFALIERVAGADISVIIEGESGTGKEMVARAIHQHSERRKGRLVTVNCAAIPEGLLESELFGHVRGAFTGADRERKGLFTAAHGGTLFLDEIGDMPARMQVDLLRALQERTIRPVGGQKDLQVDVRVLAASNKPLAGLVQQSLFREDLFYRLNVVTLHLPPLRERSDDIPLLADHFLSLIAAQMGTPKRRLTREAIQALSRYSWPGNVRQLEHSLMNAAIMADGEAIDQDDLTLDSPLDREAEPAPAAPAVEPSLTKEDHQESQRQRILRALEASSWNKSRAAQVLGIPRRTFYRRLKDYNIQ